MALSEFKGSPSRLRPKFEYFAATLSANHIATKEAGTMPAKPAWFLSFSRFYVVVQVQHVSDWP
jgi:hypothetical protein